jgi:ribulose-5-phosphate 4-epimerase/fuculose-1-phosphate aldolase
VAAAGAAQGVLLRNHGVVTFGRTVEEAAATALVVEEGARVALVSRLLGVGEELDAAEVSALRHVHLTSYGQPSHRPEA